jgi:uncharacterized repeat protein (TIGR02543 family)
MKNILLFRKLSWLFILCFGLTQLSFGQTYTKINSLAELTDGDYVIVSNSSNNAMNSTVSSGKFGGPGVTVTNNSISSPPTVTVWTITTVLGNVKNIHNTNGYVNYVSSTNLSLVTAGTANNARWTASYQNGGYFRFSNVATSSRIIAYNGSAFGGYSSGNASNSGEASNTNVYDVQLYKKVSVPSYTLTYNTDGNGSITGTTPQTVQQGDSGSEVTAVANAGYHFVNWSDDSTDNPRTDENVQADATYTANFAINTYAVTYDGNGNTSGAAPVDANSPYNYDSNVTVLGQGTLERDGHSFIGWNTSATGDGTAYAVSNVINNISDNITLYAQWLDDSLEPQTITFNPLANVTYGDDNFDLTATASSGLTVSYTSSNENVATISGNTVTITGVGETTITALQTGDGDFQPAETVQQTLTVNQKELTLSGVAVTSKEYDGNTTASFTGGSLVGVVGSDDVNFTGNVAFTTADAGENKEVTSNFSLTGANAGNYTLAQPELTGTITKADQVIASFVDITKLSTDAAFALTAATNIDQSVAYSSSNDAVATVSGNTVTIQGVGTTTITAEAEGTNNYNSFSGTITLTVNFDNTVVPVATAATGVNHNSFTANWNAVAGADSYELDVYTKEISQQTLFNETFDNINGTGGNDGTWSAISGASNATLPNNWTSSGTVREGDQCVQVGASSSAASITTPALGITGNATLTFRAGAWNGSSESTNLKITIANGGSLDATAKTMAKGSFTTYTIQITNAVAASKIKFETNSASNSRFFIDDIKVVAGVINTTAVSGSPFTGITGTSHQVTGLSPETQYHYVVRAVNGSTTPNSNEISVTTTEQPVVVPPVAITSPLCGSTLNYRNAQIASNAVSIEGHTVQYRFRIENENFNATITRDVPNFTILQASYAAYVHPAAATYNVYVALVVDGELQPESAACSISVAAAAAATQGLQNCNTILTTPSTIVFAPSVSGASQYQFEISKDGSVLQVINT